MLNLSDEYLENLVKTLKVNNIPAGCAAADKLRELAESSPKVYSYIDRFYLLLEEKNSYMRNRGLSLIAACARWDVENFINKNINTYLDHIKDEKPITVRICVQNLTQIAKYKPELRKQILASLQNPDLQKYKMSMVPLIEKDICNTIAEIEKYEEEEKQ